MSARLQPLFRRLIQRPGLVLAVVAAITGLLLIPFLTMAPTTSASTEPEGDVFTARDRIDERFVSSVHPTLVIVEHESGDVLTVEALGSLLEAQNTLRADPDLGPTLFRTFDAETGQDINGMLSLADLVDQRLRSQGIAGVGDASDEQVRAVASAVIDDLGPRSDTINISAQSVRTDDGWTVPALSVLVLSDNEQLGFGNTSINFGGGTEVEEFDRQIQDAFRVDGWQANGVAIDVNLTAQEQGAVAGPFIGFTILAVLVILGLVFGSYWVMATVSVAFLTLIIWLKGITNLIGLEDDLVLSLIVPVAMVSFGVDFAFHAIGRYREERAEGGGRDPMTAFATGLAAVSGALILALVSDATAFLANLTSGIDSINQFGIGAAIALASAYVLLGIVTPLVVAKIEATVPPPRPGRYMTVLRVFGAGLAASMAMASVLLLVFVLPWLGVILAAVTAVATLVVPWLIQRRRFPTDSTTEVESATADPTAGLARPIGSVVAALATRPLLVIPAAVALTVGAATLAIRVPAEFDVEDFFAADTDFVVGLNQLDTHIGDRGGEPAQLYVEGDLTDLNTLQAIDRAVAEIEALEDTPLARDDDGRVIVSGGVFSVFDATWESGPMVGIVAQRTGVQLTDADGDRIPDSSEQVDALLTVAADIGVPFDETRPLLTPDEVNTAVVTEGAVAATVFEMGVVDSRSQSSVTEVRDTLDPIAEQLSDDLDGNFVEVTGSAIIREASLEATNRALQVSLPVAMVLCLLVATVFLRSIRYGLASVVPIMMVISWLYAFMYLAGYAINLVTATIAAVSVGIGIDFAIHFIARYREELERLGRRDIAVRVAGEGTGLALVASAISSAVGFGILAFAPMPLFAAYGLLTALMIGLALVATLAVLPAVLVAITRDHNPSAGGSTSDQAEPTSGESRQLVGA